MTREPIAIIGIGCRLPGGVRDPESYWRLLCEPRDTITEVPPDRWSSEALYSPDRSQPGKMYVRRGGFLDNIRQFEPEFFGISPREASHMDPQQRLLLQATWEALEDGGQAPDRLAGSNVGVFIGLFIHDFEEMHTNPSERDLIGSHSAVGMSPTISANRISYVFDFKGPSMVVDTACSSSLVATHMACQSLWQGESTMCVAGGVNICFQPEMWIMLSKGSFLSPDGRCKSFDASANGYVRSEGVGIIILKRLSEAVADRDPIYAVIRGTAVNSDGRSTGLTVPDKNAQIAVIRDALRVGNVRPENVSYVEAHGTGTAVGDPIEVAALGAVFSQQRGSDNPLVIGSVKSLIGHTESTAGVAGLIKAALMLKHARIVPNLHFHTPNPAIAFDDLRIRVATQSEPWPKGPGCPRYAGVNSFGFGGTNGHAVLEAFDSAAVEAGWSNRGTEARATNDRACLVPLSAPYADALPRVVESLAAFLRTEDKDGKFTLADLAYTTAQRRGQHDARLAIVAGNRDELTERLESFLAGDMRLGIVQGRVAERRPKLAFVYSGMGPQRWNMGRKLYHAEPVFRSVVDTCHELYCQHTGKWSLKDELFGDESASRVNRTEIAQPAIFTLQAALTELWRSWGVVPDVVVGHSVGEVASAWAAGVLSLEDAVRVSFHRGRLQQTLAGRGRMLAVGLSRKDATELLKPYTGRVSIGAVNSSSSVTLSGEIAVLEEIERDLTGRNVFVRPLNVEVPFHSPVMDSMLPELRRALADIDPRPTRTTLVSTVTGDYIEGTTLGAEYWCRNVRDPVSFAESVHRMLGDGVTLFTEIAAHPALAPSLRECFAEAGVSATTLASMRRNEPEDLMLLNALGTLWTLGLSVDWKQVHGEEGRLVRLPAYPWQGDEYWLESEASKASKRGRWHAASSTTTEPVHPLLGTRLPTPGRVWTETIEPGRPAFLADHKVQNNVVFPGAGFVEMALAAGRELDPDATLSVEEIGIHSPLVIGEGRSTEVQLVLEKGDTFEIYSRATATSDDGKTDWTLHASGRIDGGPKPGPKPFSSLDDIRLRCPRKIEQPALYYGLSRRGLDYGPSFQGVDHVLVGDDEALGKINIGNDVESDWLLHPTILDAAFQVFGAIESRGTWVPVSLKRVTLWDSPPLSLWCHARITSRSGGRITGDILLTDDHGERVVEVQGLACRRVEAPHDVSDESVGNILYSSQWKRQDRDEGIQHRDAKFLPSPRALGAVLAPFADRGEADYRALYASDVQTAMDSLCVTYVVHALQQLGLPLVRGTRLAGKSMADELNITTAHRRVLDRFLEILSEEGYLEKTDESWLVVRSPAVEKPSEGWMNLLGRFPAYTAELMLLERIGSHLADILTGQQDPSSLVFSETDDVAEHLYRHSPTWQACNHLTRQAIGEITQQLPETQTIRILEIGGGTGSLTTSLLPVLPRERTEYVFTDGSATMVDRAELTLSGWSFLRTAVLSLEESPESQGFLPHSFDLILVSDLLRSTVDPCQTLGHVQRLLASGGMFIMAEVTQAPRWFDLVFGLLPNWSAHVKGSPERNRASLSAAWTRLLEESGFAETAVLDAPQAAVPAVHSVFLASGQPLASEPVVLSERAAADSARVVLLSAGGGLNGRLADLLVSRGTDTVLVEGVEEIVEAVAAGSGPVSVVAPADAFAAGSDSVADEAVAKCQAYLQFVQAMMERTWKTPVHLFLVTRAVHGLGGASPRSLRDSALWGMNRTVLSENEGIKVHSIDLGMTAEPCDLDRLAEELESPDGEPEIAIREGHRFVNRVVRLETPWTHRTPTEPWRLSRTARRGPEGLQFQDYPIQRPRKGEIQVEIRAAGLNFKDVAKVYGLLDSATVPEHVLSSPLGFEVAGVVVDVGKGVREYAVGDEVVGLTHGGFASRVNTPTASFVPKPLTMSFQEAATLPVAALTAYYALHVVARIQPGERVLIHTATGGVGLAAVQLAQAAGAEVLATAGTPGKRAFLRALGIRHVYNSRDLSFAARVIADTSGEGVDVILNTLSGKAVAKGLSLLRPGRGRFVDVNNVYARSVELAALSRGIAFFTFDLQEVHAREPELFGRHYRAAMQLVESGKMRPLPFRAFPIHEIGGALKSMRKGRHVGKIVVTTTEPGVSVEPTCRRLDVRSEATYLIVGGLGGFGAATAQWLVECGARHLVLVGRSGASSPTAQETVRGLRASGAEVRVERADVSRVDELQLVFDRIDAEMPPLGGVIHSAMVLEDAPLQNLDAEKMRTAMVPKIHGAWNLHNLTRNRELDFFICYSSIAATIGALEQANYAAANFFLESLTAERRAQGLPGLAVGWGAVGEVGYVAQNEKLADYFDRQGIYLVTLEQAWRTIVAALERQLPWVLAAPVDWDRMKKTISVIGRSSRFHNLLHRGSQAAEQGSSEKTGDDGDELDLPAEIQRAVASVLGIPNRLDVQKPLADLGFDSLMAVELSLRIEALVGVSLPKMTLLRQDLTVARLVDLVTESAGGTLAACAESASSETEAAPPSPQPEVEDVVAPPEVAPAVDENSPPRFPALVSVDDLSDDEVFEMLKELIPQ